jgi:hypothetical protein
MNNTFVDEFRKKGSSTLMNSRVRDRMQFAMTSYKFHSNERK